ncbi:MAG: AI-2E family transporter [Flavobacteriaceae bacterium]
MNSKTISEGILRAVAIIAGLVLFAYFLYEVRSVIAYIFIAAATALAGRPLVIFLRQRLRFNNTLAVITTMVLMVGILAGVISLFIPLIAKQGQNLSLLDIEALQQNIENLYTQIIDYFGISNAQINIRFRESKLLANLDFGFIPDFLNSFLGLLGTLSIGLFSVLFIAFFFLKDSTMLVNTILVLVPDDKEKRVLKSASKMRDLLSRYFLGLVMQISILFVIYTIWLLIFGIENAVVIAFLCALLNLIPYIGPVFGGALMLLLTMTSNLGADFSTVILPKTIYVLIGFVLGQLVDNFFSQPFIFGNSVRSHPLEIFIIIITGGLLFGVAGMIIAVPGYTVIKVLLQEFFADNKIVKSLTKNL